jgi:hypothetical protein
MIGSKFGKWTVIDQVKVTQKKTVFKYYNCQCECGEIKPVRSVDLNNGRSTQCRTCRDKKIYIDTDAMVGEKYGKWTVIKAIHHEKKEDKEAKYRNVSYTKRGIEYGPWKYLTTIHAPRYQEQRWVLCRCECGKELKIQASRLKLGKTTQCHLCNVTKHGLDNTPTYHTWRSMLMRCNKETNRNYKRYGGRGIKVCDRWHTFANFLEDMGIKPVGYQIDRTNLDGNYEPGNCKWVTPKQNSANRNKRPVLWNKNKKATSCGKVA